MSKSYAVWIKSQENSWKEKKESSAERFNAFPIACVQVSSYEKMYAGIVSPFRKPKSFLSFLLCRVLRK